MEDVTLKKKYHHFSASEALPFHTGLSDACRLLKWTQLLTDYNGHREAKVFIFLACFLPPELLPIFYFHNFFTEYLCFNKEHWKYFQVIPTSCSSYYYNLVWNLERTFLFFWQNDLKQKTWRKKISRLSCVITKVNWAGGWHGNEIIMLLTLWLHNKYLLKQFSSCEIQWKPLITKLKRVWKLFVISELRYNPFP